MNSGGGGKRGKRERKEKGLDGKKKNKVAKEGGGKLAAQRESRARSKRGLVRREKGQRGDKHSE